MSDEMVRAWFHGGSLHGKEMLVPVNEEREYVYATGEVYRSDGFAQADGSSMDDTSFAWEYVLQEPAATEDPDAAASDTDSADKPA